ncbi:MAG TPA: hypothetical protein VIL44_08870 [Micromonospora sp.]
MPVVTLHQHLEGVCRRRVIPADATTARTWMDTRSRNDGAGSRGSAVYARGRVEEGQ